ncbi:hypothetical protein GCM10027168_61960 [Streptomyces capparidis]
MKRIWRGWRRWRKGRPFWGGLLVVIAGAEITAIPLAPLEVMLHQGIAGVSSILMGLILILMGLTFWFAPQYRSLAGIVSVMLAAACLVLSNLGGFFFGTITAVIGGSLGFAWQPLPPQDAGDTPAEAQAAGGGPAAGTGPPPNEPPHHPLMAAGPGS